MMGVLFLCVFPSIHPIPLISCSLRNVNNDNFNVIAPDGISIENRLKSLVESTAEKIKECANVCDAYMKKRLLSKVLLSTVWDAKLLHYVDLFAERRKAFQIEMTLHISQGVDKAHLKLDAIVDATRALDDKLRSMRFCTSYALTLEDRIDVLKDILRRLISPEQKQLLDRVKEKTRDDPDILQHNNKTLLELENSTSKKTSPPGLERRCTRQGKPRDPVTDKDADNLRNDIFEDPDTAANKNLDIFSRKFEAQRDQIVKDLTLVVRQEGDKVVRELTGGIYERISEEVGFSCLPLPHFDHLCLMLSVVNS